VKHYLLDFGSTLGSGAKGPMSPYVGYDHAFDSKAVFSQLLTFGLNVRPYERNYQVKYPSIGFYTSEYFYPHKYKAHFPNPAFENMTNRDGFWGAKLVMSFTDEQLKTVVEQGQYSDPEAAAYLLKTLKERRDIIGRHWFNLMNPLDNFNFQNSPDGNELRFTDLAVDTGFEKADQSKYRYLIKQNGSNLVLSNGTVVEPIIQLPKGEELVQDNSILNKSNPGEGVWEIIILTKREEKEKWSKWVKVFFSIDNISGDYILLGLHRQE